MGKRNKNRYVESTTECHVSDLDTTLNIEEKPIINDSNKHIKKKNKLKTIQEDSNIAMENHKNIKFDNGSEHYNVSNNVNKKKKRKMQDTEKPKKIKCQDEPDEVCPENVSTDKKINQKKNTGNPKKIKFGSDGEPEEVSPENISTNKKVNKDKKSYLNAEEQDIKDEDIDQFCDDVDEEENKQYESWITLLEQKLGSNQGENKKKNKK